MDIVYSTALHPEFLLLQLFIQGDQSNVRLVFALG